MAENSKIEWCEHTFNPWMGCTRVSPACDNCYAAVSTPARAMGVAWGAGEPRRPTADANWKLPLRWNAKAAEAGRRARVFCASLADVFDNEADPALRARLFETIRATPNLDWLLLTKRIGNAGRMAAAAGGWPENVWLGATVVNQKEADRDVPKLAEIDGPRFRFLSIEPMLGRIDLTALLYQPCPNSLDGLMMDPSTGAYECCARCDFTGISDELAIHWVIVGGESGQKARPMHPLWPMSIRDQCVAAGVPFLFKQWGEWAPHRAGMPAMGKGSPEIGVAWPDGTCQGGSMHQHGGPGFPIYRVGKKAAGRLLDGVQHDGVPTMEKADG